MSKRQFVPCCNFKSAVAGLIDTKQDLDLGRSQGDHQEAKNKADRKSLRTISYLSDGEYIIGGGNSKNICIYDLRHRKMIKKIVVTKSRSLQGTLAKLNSRAIKDGLNIAEIDSEIEYQNK